MLVEARVFRSDDRMLQIGRDLAQRNELVSFVIRPAVNPGLQVALHVHSCSRWVDPPGSHKYKRGERPKKRHSDEKATNEGPERSFSKWSFAVCVGIFNHISE